MSSRVEISKIVLFGAAVLSGCFEGTTFTPLPPPPPALLQPSNGAFVGSVVSGSLQPRLLWRAVESDELVRYEVQISDRADFSGELVVAQVETPNFQPNDPLSVSLSPPVGRNFFWRVKACLPLTCSDYSKPWMFRLGRTPTDYNGDGYADLAIGAPGPTTSTGSVLIFLGRPGASYSGGLSGSLSTRGVGDAFGFSMSSAGDFNNDGFADLIVGVPGSDVSGTEAGSAYIYFGGSSTALFERVDMSLHSPSSNARFGSSVSFADDMNGDGFSDVVVGAPEDDQGGVNAGRAYIFFGGAPASGQPAGVIAGTGTEERLAESVSNGGDLNGDGFSDILISSGDFELHPVADVGCSVVVIWGGEGRTVDLTRKGSIVDTDFQLCRIRAMPAGDVDGDGLSDVVVGINRLDGKSLLRLASGSSRGDFSMRELLPLGEGGLLALGASLDFNADGRLDLLINKQQSGAQGLIYFGRDRGDGFELSPPSVLGLGSVTTSPGDINGDGISDILLAAPSDAGDAGRVSVHLGVKDSMDLPSVVDLAFGASGTRVGAALAGKQR